MANQFKTKVVTGKVRFSFVNVFEPRAFGEGMDAKYSVMLLIPKSDVGTIDRIKESNRCGCTERFIQSLAVNYRLCLKLLKDADKDTNQDGEVFKDVGLHGRTLYLKRVKQKSTADCRRKPEPNN